MRLAGLSKQYRHILGPLLSSRIVFSDQFQWEIIAGRIAQPLADPPTCRPYKNSYIQWITTSSLMMINLRDHC